jgi:hypothetical protein
VVWPCSGRGEDPTVAPPLDAGEAVAAFGAGPQARSRCLTVMLGLLVEGLAACHGVLVGSGGLRRRVCVAAACEGFAL